MEVGEASRKELQEQVSWIPTTPVKPILPRSVPICSPKEGNQLDQTNCSRTSSCCISSNDSVVACFESSPGAEIKSSQQDWAAPAATVTNVAVNNVGTCVQPSFDNLSIWNNVRFSDLLALADAASAHTNATHLGNGMKIPIIPTLKSQFKGDPVANPTSTFLSPHNLSTDQITSSTIYGNPQEPHGTPCSACCSKTISQFAPPTPDKAIGAQGRQIAGMQINMEEKYQGEEETTLLATKLDVSEIPHNQELCDLVMESSFAAVSMPFKENHNPDKEGSHGTDLNRMPQQKLRRKNKHRPKVITEDKPKKTRIPVIPKPCRSKENQTGKRKYVRQKGLNSTSTTPPTEVTGEFTELMMPEFNKKSCRKSLNFDIEEQSRDENSACRENATVHLCKGVGVSIAERHVGLACDLNFSMKQGLNDYKSLPEDTQAPSMSLLKSNSPGTKLNAHSVKNNCKRKSRVTSQDGQQNNAKMTSKSRRPSSPNYSNSNNSGILITGFQMDGSKRKHFSAIEHADTSSINLIGVQYNGLQAYQAICRDQFPNVSKKRRRGKGKISNTSNSDRQSFNDAGAPQTCNEPLVAEKHTSLTKKERAIKNILASSTYSSTNEAQVHHQFVLETLTEQFRHLKINREARDQALHEQNTLIPYNQQNQKNKPLVHGGGIIIPLENAFEHIRKRTRPKVELDEETNRVWQLLLLNINSHGIDGTDEEKAKWWDEERRVFRGRADSFIARMHLVQGDRRFSQWKGSVVDSAIGVFLTQNVSDHLSSSAFMSLAARFPLKSSSNCKTYHKEGTSLVVSKPQVHIVEPEENTKYDQKSVTIDIIERSEETEAVNSNDSSRTTCTVICEPRCSMLCGPTDTITGEGQETHYGGVREELNDKVSSQCSVISAQISGNFSTDQNLEKIGSCSDSNSEVEDLSSAAKYNIFDNITSFTKLLEMASSTMLHEINSQGSKSTENLKDAYDQSIGMKHDNQTENLEISDVIQGSLEASIITSCEHTLKMTPNSGFDIHCFDTFKRESVCDFSKSKDENDMDNPSLQTTESPAAITHSQSMLAQLHLQDQSNNMQQSLFCSSGQTQNLMQKARDLDSGDQNYAVWNEPLERNAAPTRPKSRRLGKKKKDNINWDNLRKQALVKTGKRQRTANTMDSLDWDAVRRADVNEIADAIKDRGMNNVLAERIKNFLNRLVEEHGDIDLEWLREVPPDQAKEYLLSIRGLGLKSVECVRLLTLHHLAFPVDTNVGRIAVRLGWVPLQPLPESLQLHLLEMYPVLESIQKYLWPRLCKLEQRTLYELHYQMITFGKVFCTKSKPNCNACPMRGECRHFASAFASARLALPGPEQKSIVSTAGNNTTDQNRSVIVSPLSLPLPGHTNQAEEIQQTEVSRQLESNSEINICQPIIEEPATPEPECTQIAENDIEDAFYGDPCEIPTIKLNIEEFTLNLQSYMQENMELEECEMSKALVALTPEAASIPTPKLKNVSQLRTEHCVYELPDSHPLLQGWDNREPDDPCKYLLAIWTPGESATSIQPPESKCSSQECGQLCNEKECFACNSIREANSQIVRGTILIPCRTAMRGSFPLNGTYFQVNEVFADHDSSLNPINVPRSWIWNLNRRTVYFGTSIPSIFKGLSTQEIQQCFWRGYVCVRGFDRERRAPRPLMARLHFPASKLAKAKDKTYNK